MRCLVTPRKEECLFWHFAKLCFYMISRQIVEMICWQHVQNTISRGTNMTAWQNEMLYVRCSIYTNTVRLFSRVSIQGHRIYVKDKFLIIKNLQKKTNA